MNRENIYYSQLSEAIKFAEYNLFPYKRISLILLDNIVENLLSAKANYYARHWLMLNKLSKPDCFKIIKSLNRFENATKFSNQFEIIGNKEKPLLEYCHKARNNAYHYLYVEERIADCCILMLSEFIYKNIVRLNDFGIYSIEHEEKRNILAINNLNSTDELLEKIKSYCENSEKPSDIFSEMIIGFLNEINEFIESNANEDLETFNSIIKEQYLNEIQTIEQLESIEKPYLEKLSYFKKGWKDFKATDFVNLKNQSLNLKKLSTIDAFEKFINIFNRVYPYYLLMKFYVVEQENQAY